MDIYTGIKVNDSLISLLKKWYPKAPKKFSSNLVNEVHQIVINANSRDLYEILLNTSYFNNVLWAFFHQDITLNHIELLICTTLYDIEKGHSKLIDMVLADGEAFQALFERLLNITIAPAQLKNLRLQKSILLFINQLVTFKLSHPLVKKTFNGLFGITIWSNLHNYQTMVDNNNLEEEFSRRQAIIQDCDDNSTKTYLILKQRWAFTVITNYMSSLTAGEMIQHLEFIEYLDCLIQILISCVSQLPIRNYFNSLLKGMQFLSCFHVVDDKNKRLLEFVKILKHFMNYPINDFTGEEYLEGTKYQDNFYSLQKIIFEKFSGSSQEKINKFILVPSVYNYSHEKLKEFLSNFALDDLVFIADKLKVIDHISNEFRNNEFITSAIANEVFTPEYNVKGLSQLVNNYTEVDIIDDFNDIYTNENVFQPIPLPQICNTQYLCLADYVIREVVNLTTDIKRLANNHINQVLQRLKLSVDPQSNLKIKGTSKYFSKIESLNVFDKSTAELIISTNKDWQDNIDDYILLIQLIKPNKYSSRQRMVKYGLNMVRFKKVLELNGNGKQRSLVIDWNEELELSDRFNYIIRLPAETSSLDKLSVIANDIDVTDIRLPEYFTDLFLGIDKSTAVHFKSQQDRPYKLKIDCMNASQLRYELEVENNSKRRKGNNKQTSADPPYLLKFNQRDDKLTVESIIGQQSTYRLNEEQAQCIIPSVSTGASIIDAPQNSDGDLLQAIIYNLQLNFPKERTLILCPNDIYLGRFEIKLTTSLKVYGDLLRYNMKINELFDSIKIKLEQAEILSEFVGLKDMGFGQTPDNALLLFSKIKQEWGSFLHSVKKDRLQITSYPFKEFSKILLGGAFESDLQKIVTSYKEITQVFQDIQNLAPLVKLQNKKGELIKFLICKYCQYILVTPETLISQKVYHTNFDSIICIGENIPQFNWLLPMINNAYLRRIIVLGDFSRSNKSRWRYLNVPPLKLRKVPVREEFLQYYNDQYNNELVSAYNGAAANGGFKETHQIIPVEIESNGSVSVNEAEYSVALYQYMRLLGYPAHKVSIIAMTAYQKVLIEEILSIKCGDSESSDSSRFKFGWPTVEIDDCCNANAYLIVSAFDHKYPKLKCLASATSGLYIVGNYTQNSFPKQNLTVVNGEMYNKLIRRDSKHLYEIVGYDHLRQYVDQMTTMRMSAAK